MNLVPVSDSYDQEALLERLTAGIRAPDREVVFLVGSGLSAPDSSDSPGVPGVGGIVSLIEAEFDAEQALALGGAIAGVDNQYQAAFHFLQGRRGQQAVNGVIRKAVSQARRRPPDGSPPAWSVDATTADAICKTYDDDWGGWHLAPGMRALGALAAGWPAHFGQTVLTTNFDPLISASVKAANGECFRTALHRDGNLGQTIGSGTHVVHLHGYWFGADTLHTPRQLSQARPQLRAALSSLLRDRVVVVLAYGGWDDVFTKALLEVVLDDGAHPEVVWTFRNREPLIRQELQSLLDPGIDRGRVSFYTGIDANVMLPLLLDRWSGSGRPPSGPPDLPPLPSPASLAVEDPATERGASRREQERRLRMMTAGEDRPPEVDAYVDRASDRRALEDGNYRVAFVTGIGGQGKSALAGAFFNGDHAAAHFDHSLWRDCKEQNFRFEDHLLSIVQALGEGEIAPAELAKQSIEDLARLFARLTVDLRLLVVFDNVDHYVDLEHGVLVGAAGSFLATFLDCASEATLVFTCRPAIIVSGERVLSHRLGGMLPAEAEQLFRVRRADADQEAILRAHEATGGHALWLDLLAAQVARAPRPGRLHELLDAMRATAGEIPEATLRSIWLQLAEREQMVLQVLAETMRPTTALQIADYLGSRLRFNRVSKALAQLRGLSLVVAKRQDDGDAFELHPLIRAFIRRTQKKIDRVWYIDAILRVYNAVMDVQRPSLAGQVPGDAVRRWLETAELHVNADRLGQALEALGEISGAALNEAPVDFTRVATLVFARDDLRDMAALPEFDEVFAEYSRTMVNLGRTEAASEALDRYEATLSGKDARYINLCDMRCYLHWSNGNYPAALRWGAEGVQLRKGSGVDTAFDSAHNLALAQRDAGAVDLALTFFLDGVELEQVVEPGRLDPDRNEAYYGNVGRCLQLMGQVDPALACYRKSARLAQRGVGAYITENQAYIRQWIGELLQMKGDAEGALAFLVAARTKWEHVSPPRAEQLTHRIEGLFDAALGEVRRPTASQAEAYCVRWMDV